MYWKLNYVHTFSLNSINLYVIIYIIHMYIYVYLCIFTYVYVYVYVYIYIYIYIYYIAFWFSHSRGKSRYYLPKTTATRDYRTIRNLQKPNFRITASYKELGYSKPYAYNLNFIPT